MRILLIGSYGQNNVGDELLLEAFLRNLSPVSEAVIVNTDRPEQTLRLHGTSPIEVIETRGSKKLVWQALKGADVLIFGGGNLIKELHREYGDRQFATLLRILALTTAARRLGKPIWLVGVGIGPLKTHRGFALGRTILRQAEHTSLRDSESQRHLPSIGYHQTLPTIPDPVFTDTSLLERISQPQAGRFVIGVSVCRNIHNPHNWERFFSALIESLIELHIRFPEIEYVGLPMQYDTDRNNDLAELTVLQQQLRVRAPGVRFHLTKPQHYRDLIDHIAAVDLLVGARLHTLILATLLGKPFVALNYDAKVAGFVEDLGVPLPVIDISDAMTPEMISGAVTEVREHYDALASQLRETARSYHDAALTFWDSLRTKLAQGSAA